MGKIKKRKIKEGIEWIGKKKEGIIIMEMLTDVMNWPTNSVEGGRHYRTPFLAMHPIHDLRNIPFGETIMFVILRRCLLRTKKFGLLFKSRYLELDPSYAYHVV